MNPHRFFVGRALGLLILLLLVGIAAGAYWIWNHTNTNSVTDTNSAADYKNIAYTIDGKSVTLHDGIAESEAAPGSASKIVTKYFGNELKTDLDGDGREDIVFLLTQETGGSGTFFYVVAARNTGNGYVGSDGYLLGDRIAPQTTELSQNPKQKYVIVVTYADRVGEPMTTQPSIGKSVYLKLDTESMQWGIVASDFEGESDGSGEKTGYNFWAVPTSGKVPLAVAFSANPQDANQYLIDYGDGTNSGPIQSHCLSNQPYPGYTGPAVSCSVEANHNYSATGTYTAMLTRYVACLYSNPRCLIAIQELGSVTITVR